MSNVCCWRWTPPIGFCKGNIKQTRRKVHTHQSGSCCCNRVTCSSHWRQFKYVTLPSPSFEWRQTKWGQNAEWNEEMSEIIFLFCHRWAGFTGLLFCRLLLLLLYGNSHTRGHCCDSIQREHWMEGQDVEINKLFLTKPFHFITSMMTSNICLHATCRAKVSVDIWYDFWVLIVSKPFMRLCIAALHYCRTVEAFLPQASHSYTLFYSYSPKLVLLHCVITCQRERGARSLIF